LRGFRGSKKAVALILLSILALCWVTVYSSSLYQRRKGERFIADLKTFPFSTADFAQVRDFVLQHGGIPIQDSSLTAPSVCSVRDCVFRIQIGHPLSRPPAIRRLYRFFYPILTSIGFRPWLIDSQFEVQNGVLMRSATTVGQVKRVDWRAYDGLLIMEYWIHTDRSTTPYSRPDDRGDRYTVTRPHVTGPPIEILESWVVQTPAAPMNRVFDIDLHCFTTIFHGCSDLGALAPSAWQDREAALKSR